MSKVLITGGSGFIGTNLIDFYLKKNANILNLDIAAPRNKKQSSFWKQVDILEKNKLSEAIHQFDPDLVFHLAARTDLDGKSLADYSANTQGVTHTIDAISDLKNLKMAVFASSRLVCKIDYLPKDELDYCPINFYGESKVLGEKILRDRKDLKIPWALVRPTSIWGPWFDVPYLGFFLAIQKGLYFHPRGKEIRKSYGYVGNTVYELFKIASSTVEQVNRKMFYLSDYPPLEVGNWAQLIQEEMGSKPIKKISLDFLKLAALSGDFLKKLGFSNPPLTSFRLNNLITEMVYNTADLEKVCGNLPYPLPEAVHATVDWIKQHHLKK